MVGSGEVKFREDVASPKIDGEVVDVGEWIPVWNGLLVQSAVVSAWPPVSDCFGDHV